jgi:hypothetical protein
MTIQTVDTQFIPFFEAQTTSANSAGFPFLLPKGTACLKFWGTWDGATILFQTITPFDNTYWVPILNLSGAVMSFTQDGQVTLENVVYGDLIRCVLSNAGGSTNLNVTAQII